MIIYGATDTGRQHPSNEDSIFPAGYWPSPHEVSDEAAASLGYLVAVADGVSAASLAQQASQKVVTTLVERYYSGNDLVSSDVALVAATAAANSAAYDITEDQEAEDVAATTLVAAVIKDNVVRVVHAGDSRAYLVTPQQVVSLTTDHSVVQELVEEGSISPAEADTHPESGVLTRALGVENEVQLDLSPPIPLEEADCLVLCSDGLYTLVSEREISDAVRGQSPAKAAHRLIDLANRRGGYDNISVVIATRQHQPTWRQRLFGR
ncbi:MAG: serine/threonine-protein phosphatase [Anaerolineae bacterium]|nr:serine/threonine-protein phosphatase [Anaerolineae bacterium]